MNVDYWPIGAGVAQPIRQAAGLITFATHAATDWHPGHPTSVTPGLTSLLAEVLEQQTVNGHLHWTANRTVAGFERQWRGVTSFIVGSSVCGWIADQLGYQWRIPVRFYEHNQAPTAPFHWWVPAYELRQCSIASPIPRLKNLRPDYVLLRRTAAGEFQVAFAEAKGTTASLASMAMAPQSWQRQVRNAEFAFDGTLIPIHQRIIVAARLMPTNKTASARKVQVRAWNTKHEAPPPSDPVVHELLKIHYMGVLEKLGFRATAERLAYSRIDLAKDRRLPTPGPRPGKHGTRTGFGMDDIDRVDRSDPDVEVVPIENHRIQLPRTPGIIARNQLLRVGLHEGVMTIVDALISGDEKRITSALDLVPATAMERETMFVRADGVCALLK